MTAYRDAFDQAMQSPEIFWRGAAEAIVWSRPFERVLDDSRAPLYRWFAGGELNTCFNAIDFHVENGRAAQPAVIYDSPVTGTKRTLSYRELLRSVAQFAGALSALGVVKGDRVVDLHADDAGDSHRHVRLRSDRRDSFGGLRRICRE